MRRLLKLGVGALLSLGVASAASAADILPMYINLPGVNTGTTSGGFPVYFQNTAHTTFTAAVSGDIWAYYTGSSASDAEWLGLLTGISVATLTDTGFHGLENHTPPPITPANPFVQTPLGAAFDLGHVNAGETYVFYIQDLNPDRSSQQFFSDYTKNLDGVGGAAVEHVYSTSFTAGAGTNNVSTGAPGGEFTVPEGVYTYLGFEDLPATDEFADFNYHDETFLFRQVADPVVIAPGGVPEPATWGLLIAGFAGLGAGLRRARAKGLATA